MLKLIFERRFKKDTDMARQRHKDLNKLKTIIATLANNNQLSPKHRNHKLKGNFVDCWECHIEPDWLLIYKKTDDELILVRTGTHSDLF